MEGKVSSDYGLTLPLEVREALGIKPGDTVLYQVEGGKLEVSLVRPDILKVMDELLEKYDWRALHEEIGNDAVAYVRRMRGWDEWEDDDER